VETTLRDEECARFDAIYQAMLFAYAPRPVSSPFITQRLRLADTSERVFLNVRD
jgi:hypothetical protein